MNEKKSVSNRVYYDSEMQALWLEYGHPADEEEELPACEKEVK